MKKNPQSYQLARFLETTMISLLWLEQEFNLNNDINHFTNFWVILSKMI